MTQLETLLAFFKALSDTSRLRIVGLLAHRPYAVEELATVLDLRPSTVSHHLAKLTAASLVRAKPGGHYHIYSLDLDAFQARARTLLADEELRGLVDVDGELDPFDKKVLETFLDPEGRLKQLPMKRKKLKVVLRHALRLFQDDGPWDEKEVNRRLNSISDDTATLRRGLIDYGYLEREQNGSAYWRAQV